MNHRIDILNELKDLNSSLPAQNTPHLYMVPDGYFEGLAATILAKIKEEDNLSVAEELSQISPLLAGLSRNMPYTVPQNYFEADDLSFITEEEKLPGYLANLERSMPMEVPEAYFETLPQIILARVSETKARVVSISKRWMRIAAAATIAGVIALSGYVYFNSKNNISVDNPQWVAKKLKNVDTKELDAFIQMTDVTVANTKAPAVNAAELKTLLQDVSNEELEIFLEELSTEDEEEITLLN